MVHFREDGAIEAGDVREMEANAFAASLLMPEPLIRQHLREREVDALDEAAVRGLAQRYAVSQQALTIRLIRLGLLSGLQLG